MNILEKFDAEIERRKKLMPVLEESVKKLAEKYNMTKSTIDGAYFAKNDNGCWVKLQACWNQKSLIKVTCSKYFKSPMGENRFGYNQIFDNREAADTYLETEIKKLEEGLL